MVVKVKFLIFFLCLFQPTPSTCNTYLSIERSRCFRKCKYVKYGIVILISYRDRISLSDGFISPRRSFFVFFVVRVEKSNPRTSKEYAVFLVDVWILVVFPGLRTTNLSHSFHFRHSYWSCRWGKTCNYIVSLFSRSCVIRRFVWFEIIKRKDSKSFIVFI